MLGNLQGWIISLVIALSGGYLLWVGSRSPRVSEPSGAFPNLLSKVALPADPRSVSPASMSGACDAGEKYRAAIDEFLRNRQQYDKWYTAAQSALQVKPKSIELLVEASDCGHMALFTRTPAEVVNYDPEPLTLDAIERLGAMAIQTRDAPAQGPACRSPPLPRRRLRAGLSPLR